jgi:acetyl esterase/lipase
MFLAVGNEDFLFNSVISAFKTLNAARHPVELHVYNKTAHGFGMRKLGQTSDLWFDEFLAWMSSLGYMSRH